MLADLKDSAGLGLASWRALGRLNGALLEVAGRPGQVGQGAGPGQGLELGAGLGHAICISMKCCHSEQVLTIRIWTSYQQQVRQLSQPLQQLTAHMLLP